MKSLQNKMFFGGHKKEIIPFIIELTVLDNDTIILPLTSGVNYNFDIDWGDGTIGHVDSYNSVDATHTYINAGIYNVSMKGIIEYFVSSISTKLTNILQWGNNKFQLIRFYNHDLLSSIDAVDIPIITSDTHNAMFQYSNNIFYINNLENWDVSNISNFFRMFHDTDGLNQNLNSWNMSNAVNTGGMFHGCHVFNQPLNNWDMSNVVNTSQMFKHCYRFNQPLNNWDMSNVSDMSEMFENCNDFNQDISMWNISSLTNATRLFNRSTFSTENYDKLLIGWEAQPHNSNVRLDVSNTKYTLGGAAEAARNSLIADGWTINDLGGI